MQSAARHIKRGSFSGWRETEAEPLPGVVAIRHETSEPLSLKLLHLPKQRDPIDYWKETLAIGHLRAWVSDRRKLTEGHIWVGQGRPTNKQNNTLGNSRLVRCHDFERILNLLPPRYAAILILWYRDGLGHQEISIRLNCDPKTVYNHLKLARTELYLKLEKVGIL